MITMQMIDKIIPNTKDAYYKVIKIPNRIERPWHGGLAME